MNPLNPWLLSTMAAVLIGLSNPVLADETASDTALEEDSFTMESAPPPVEPVEEEPVPESSDFGYPSDEAEESY